MPEEMPESLPLLMQLIVSLLIKSPRKLGRMDSKLPPPSLCLLWVTPCHWVQAGPVTCFQLIQCVQGDGMPLQYNNIRLHKILSCEQTYSRVFPCIAGFEEASCHKPYKHKEINSANDMSELRGELCPHWMLQASTQLRSTPWMKIQEDPASHAWAPEVQKPWGNKCVLFRPVRVTVCYTAMESWYGSTLLPRHIDFGLLHSPLPFPSLLSKLYTRWISWLCIDCV